MCGFFAPGAHAGGCVGEVLSGVAPGDAVEHVDLVADFGVDDGAGQWQFRRFVGGVRGLGQQAGGVPRGGGVDQLALIGSASGQADDVDSVAQRPGAGSGGQADVAGEHDAGDAALGDGHLGDAGGAVDQEPAFGDVDARPVFADVDDAVGARLVRRAGCSRYRSGGGVVGAEVAELLVETGGLGSRSVEQQAASGQGGDQQSDGGIEPGVVGFADDYPLPAAGVAVSGVGHGVVDGRQCGVAEGVDQLGLVAGVGDRGEQCGDGSGE